MSAREDLLAAADYIEAHGWTQYNYVNGAGQVCAIGALQAVTDGTVDTIEQPRLLAAKAWLLLHLGGSIISWNDAKERKQAEVVAALRAAAEVTL